jgi:hypothetical protein
MKFGIVVERKRTAALFSDNCDEAAVTDAEHFLLDSPRSWVYSRQACVGIIACEGDNRKEGIRINGGHLGYLSILVDIIILDNTQRIYP